MVSSEADTYYGAKMKCQVTLTPPSCQLPPSWWDPVLRAAFLRPLNLLMLASNPDVFRTLSR